MTVKTKDAPHRSLSFQSFDDVLAELDRIEAASDRVRTTGNWSAGENLEHVAKFIGFSLDGFGGMAPWWFRRLAVAFMKKRALGPGTMPAGIRLPSKASDMLPTPGTTLEGGLGALRTQIGRVQGGERMEQPSPIFESMSHGDWTTIHLKHAALHLGFITY
ncbi:MAG: DUF1569 domain-containing protein [Phycisphaerales bacterium]|nr:DUF1569 domain-containing protein [Phycisphaerales bacterium]